MTPEVLAMLSVILGLREDWDHGYCQASYPDGSRGQQVCIVKQEAGHAWAERVAPIFVEEAERQGIDPVLLVSVAFRESRIEGGDVCRRDIESDRIVSRDLQGTREAVTFVSRDGERTFTRVVTVIEEKEDGSIRVDTCSAGEMGTMQLIPNEARSGMIVPSTGNELPRNARERRLVVLEPDVNISLGALALVASRDYQCKHKSGDAKTECEQDWRNWIGAYNTGARSGSAWERYRDLVENVYDKAKEIWDDSLEDYENDIPPEYL